MLMLLGGFACFTVSTYVIVFIGKMPKADDIDY